MKICTNYLKIIDTTAAAEFPFILLISVYISGKMMTSPSAQWRGLTWTLWWWVSLLLPLSTITTTTTSAPGAKGTTQLSRRQREGKISMTTLITTISITRTTPPRRQLPMVPADTRQLSVSTVILMFLFLFFHCAVFFVVCFRECSCKTEIWYSLTQRIC